MMEARPWSPGEVATLIQRKHEGATYRTIGDELGRTPKSVKHKWESLSSDQRNAQPASTADVSRAALEMELAAARAKLAEKENRPRQHVHCDIDDDPEPDWAEQWKRAEQDSAKRIARARKLTQLSTRFDDQLPIAVAFVSDQHIAPGTPVDFVRMREDAELIANTPGLYAVLAGDGVDNHIRILPAMLNARSQPDDQWQLFNWYLEIFADKILALCAGNHDLWTNQVAGVDVLRRIVERQRVRYSQNEFFLTLDVAGQQYKIAARHQYRYNSSFSQGHTVRQWLRLGEEDFDVGCIGHHHEGALDNFLWRGLHRIAIRPGSYQITSAYSAQYGFNRAVPLCPTVIFWPGQRKMVSFFDVRDAAEALARHREQGTRARSA